MNYKPIKYKIYERKIDAPPVTVCLTAPYNEREQEMFNAIVEVYELDESKIIRQETTNKITSVVLTYDEFQQIYAHLLSELDRQVRQVKNLPDLVQNVGSNFSLHTWYQETQVLLDVLQYFREAERGYLHGRMTLSRLLMLNKAGKE